MIRFFEDFKSNIECDQLRDIYSTIEDDINTISLRVKNSFIYEHYYPNYHPDTWDNFDQPPPMRWISNQMRRDDLGFTISQRYLFTL